MMSGLTSSSNFASVALSVWVCTSGGVVLEVLPSIGACSPLSSPAAVAFRFCFILGNLALTLVPKTLEATQNMHLQCFVQPALWHRC